MMIVAILILFIAALDLKIHWYEGVILSLIYIGYLIFLLRNEHFKIKKPDISVIKEFAEAFLGIFFITFSAYYVVESAVFIAKAMSINSFVIGLFIGLGTSFPELAISLKAIVKKSEGISLGTLLGSNITDPLLSLGLGASITGFSATLLNLVFDLPVWLFVTCVALYMLYNKQGMSKPQARILIVLYFVYILLSIGCDLFFQCNANLSSMFGF